MAMSGYGCRSLVAHAFAPPERQRHARFSCQDSLVGVAPDGGWPSRLARSAPLPMVANTAALGQAMPYAFRLWRHEEKPWSLVSHVASKAARHR